VDRRKTHRIHDPILTRSPGPPGERVRCRALLGPCDHSVPLGGLTPENEPERTPELRSKALENGVEVPDFVVEKADFEVEKARKRG
jgi:hypothetical protein